MKNQKKTTTESGRQFVERWKRVNDFQREEYRQLTPEERLRQFFYLMAMAKEMNWQTSTPEEIEEVRRRWKKIKANGGQ